jgi:hypothetical protein
MDKQFANCFRVTRLKIAVIKCSYFSFSELMYLRNHSFFRCLENLLGFTRIFREIVKSKKPILGHNMLMDLMIWYDKFYRPLPGRKY